MRTMPVTASQQRVSLPESSGTPELERLAFDRFLWGAGVECSFLPHLGVDQFQWTQHEKFWREDLKRARQELGIEHLRYAFPWHVLEPQPGQFHWDYADERMAEFKKLGMTLLLDVMHFGTPTWLAQAVGDPEFPEALERFTEALVTRYRGQVRTWCPCNEPLVCALFSGDFGFWPPHARHWRGYMPVLSRVTQGVNRAIRAIRRAAPEANVLHVDNVESFKTRVSSLQVEVRRRNLRRFLVLDLLMGRVDSNHPLYPWLTAYGFSEIDLDWFKSHPQPPDLLGLDYYPHSDWQLEIIDGVVHQRRADNPVGLYGIGKAYYQRYGIPMLLTETSIEGKPINREIWFESTVEDARRLREEGIPLLGYFWWPLLDQLDWDGALTHRIGKIHQVGLYALNRQPDGTLERSATSVVPLFREAAAAGEQRVGKLEKIIHPTETDEDQGPPIGVQANVTEQAGSATLVELPASRKEGTGNGNGSHAETLTRAVDAAPGMAAEAAANRLSDETVQRAEVSEPKDTGRYGIVVFSHLRWGFVWQRPQQFLSRLARKHPVLFVEEPMFDLREGQEPRLQMHKVMPNVVVACVHAPQSWNRNPALPTELRRFTQDAIDQMNESGAFDRPLLWYYSPMDSSWSLGQFANRGIVYDAMDELSQFTGAPKALVANEQRLMTYADVVFAGGYELWTKKSQRHANAHFFGCGVEYEHFAKAQDGKGKIPADIDFMARPILGWFGVVDERVDYAMVGDMARLRPGWSFAMVGPVVKVDPNHLPHAPNLFWMGGRDYQVLPDYCRAFDICMMPFALNSATEYINPTKALEYFATGRPVISTPVKDVVRQYEGDVEIVKTAEEFVTAAERLLGHPDKERINRCIERARQAGWDHVVSTMQKLIAEAIGKSDRPSKQKIDSLAEDLGVLSYMYQPTQGS